MIFSPKNNPAAPPVSDINDVMSYVTCSSIMTFTISDNAIETAVLDMFTFDPVSPTSSPYMY